MNDVYFLPDTIGFIPANFKDDGTYTRETWPKLAVLLTKTESEEFWKKCPPPGKVLGSLKSRPAWVDIPKPPPATAEQVKESRLKAYADPLTGSDRLFSEALRMEIMGELGLEDVKQSAIDRFKEIQRQNPWPKE